MKKWEYNQIISFLKIWVKQEGLCRFCRIGRQCGWSRRGRQKCPSYSFANEMDCFHLWIACFDEGVTYREGYETPDSYPWMNEPPEADVPPTPTDMFALLSDKEKAKAAKIRQLRNKRQYLMQKIEDFSCELEKVKAELVFLKMKTNDREHT